MAGMDEVMRMLMEMKESAAEECEDNWICMEAMQREIADLKGGSGGDGGPNENNGQCGRGGSADTWCFYTSGGMLKHKCMAKANALAKLKDGKEGITFESWEMEVMAILCINWDYFEDEFARKYFVYNLTEGDEEACGHLEV
jgi:hypothetical protein